MENKKKLIPIIAVAAVAVIAVVAFVIIRGNNLSASTMRMLRTEGVVKLFEADHEKSITKNLRLNAGNVLNTENSSLAGIALDDTKILTIDELSSIKVDQKGKKLDVNLTAGSLYFEVTKKLDSDETFDIRTSTMVVGIRGTSGYIAVDKNGEDVVMITDGEVEVIGTNPVTGETKKIKVKAGQQVKAYLYNDRTKDSIMFEVEDVKEEDLNTFVVKRLVESERLITTVCDDTGWDKKKILGFAEAPEQTPDNTQLAEIPAEPEPVASAPEAATEGEGEENKEPEEGAPAEGTTQGDGAPAENGNEGADGGQGNNDGNANGQAKQAAATTTSAPKTGIAARVANVDASGLMHLTDGSTFDPGYYAANNSDVVAAIGNDPYKLLEHYLSHGVSESRAATATADTSAPTVQSSQAPATSEEDQLEQLKQFEEAMARAEAEAAEEERIRAASQSGGDSTPAPAPEPTSSEPDSGGYDPDSGRNDPWQNGGGGNDPNNQSGGGNDPTQGGGTNP